MTESELDILGNNLLINYKILSTTCMADVKAVLNFQAIFDEIYMLTPHFISEESSRVVGLLSESSIPTISQ